MAMATYDKKGLNLYKNLQSAANRLGNWEETKQSFITLCKDDEYTLAEVYIYEKDYPAAIKLANEHVTYHAVIDHVVENIKQIFPKEAISLYQKIVQEYIDHKSRDDYREAAAYSKKIKSIYDSILKDPISWEKYLNALRMRYKHFRALQDEFKNL